ncbi:ABC transporter ATP-binding protein [Methanosphaera sp. ISO3-F5]|uniref:ABC transporter ATP-binding protein n=1 Tax=Methanosphaera sp. ISO3-F5 TaxID=1452353 RepID=UPI002B261F58|nr:ABC transporter ATP-binding protein [Methanosphaera sp. ISO3-F5]
MSNIVSIRDLKKFYDNGETKALNGINLDIRDGEFVSIIGPSGSGKSTLLNMIGALDIPDSGRIIVDGIDLNNSKENLSKFRSEKIGFIFQLHNLIPNLSVIENVQIPLIGKHLRVNRKKKQRAEELLKSVGLEDKIHQNPTKMSGGQRQRVAIARALINEPSIIIADEPTGALDTKTSQVIMDLLKKLHEERNVTLIVVTHDPAVANQADRIITVRDGKVIDAHEANASENEYDNNEIEDNTVDFVDYVNEEEIVGTDIPKHILIKMDNKKMRVKIRALTSNQIRSARLEEDKGNGTFQENIVHMGAYSLNDNNLPMNIIQTRIPAGVIDKLSDRIIKYSLYGQ